MLRKLEKVVVVLAAVTLAGCRDSGDPRSGRDPELLHAAMRDLTGVIVYDIFSPPHSSRVYAYASVAAYEALRHDYPAYRTLAGQVAGLTPVPAPAPDSVYSLPLAAVHAFMVVGRELTFSRPLMDSLRASLEERIRRTGIPSSVYERSLAYGDRVAGHVLEWSRGDRFLEMRGMPKFSVTAEPGRWIPTPPAYMDAVEPNWSVLRPFVMDSASQFRPVPPPPFDMTPGSPFYRQVKEVYDVQKGLTDEERAIAGFWDCNPYVMNVTGHTMFATKKISPGGHWMGIATIASRTAGADIMKSAAVYARTAIALQDAFIAVWTEKYRSNLVRPETVINRYLDEEWMPVLQTPPFPEYMSGHSVISAAAAAVLTDEFGDGFRFDDSAEVDYGLPVRSFPSFKAAADEAAISRLYGGIHYRVAIEEGVKQGRLVGDLVVRRVRTTTDVAAWKSTTSARPVTDGAGR